MEILDMITTHIEELSSDETQAYETDIKLGDKVVGFVEHTDTDDDAIISNILIKEEFRNKGIGTAVLKQLISEYYSVTLAPDNEGATRLYERLGFEELTTNAPEIDQGFGVWKI